MFFPNNISQCCVLANEQEYKNLNIERITQVIEAKETGEKGKNYFFCSNGTKCSTENVVKEYYQNKGYQVMRAEVNFWQGMFCLAFFEEIYSVNTDKINDIPTDLFSGKSFYEIRKNIIDKKYEYLKTADLSFFINNQIKKHGEFKTRLLYNIPIDDNYDSVEYFKTSIVQDFLKRIDNNTFDKIVYRIAQNPNQNRSGVADFIIWNNKELVFVEVKKINERIRAGQLTWAEFMELNGIPIRIVRVKGL